MTSTYVQLVAPRTAQDAATDLPADLVVQVGLDEGALTGSVPLKDFLAGAGGLTLDERRLLVDQALVLLEDNYVHLPLKVAMHAVNPVQRLRLLRTRLTRLTPATMGPEWEFHRELSEVFLSVRDLHTNYLLPAPFNGKIAYLPFQIESFVDGAVRRYLVSRRAQGFTAPQFEVGAMVTHWNGMPVERAVMVNANRFAGSNLAARVARGIESLTIRPLRLHLPPDEEWVTISYVGGDGVRRELRENWLVADNLPPMADADSVSTTAAAQGIDLGADETGRARQLLFAPHTVANRRGGTQGGRRRGRGAQVAAAAGDVATSMPEVFRARAVTTASGTFGHLRIFSFNVDDPDGFVAEFVRLLGLLPQNGLILDVRGNGGGHIYASEFTLQTLTPRRIEPEPVQFIDTPLNLAICRRHKDNPTGQIDLGPWFASLDQAVETGATFSAAFPITPADGANAIGQRYTGPVVLVVDARCYSATDIFAAGFQDHGIGPVLGVDDNTGAGGANVWTHGLLTTLLQVPTPDASSPYRPLPRQANMRVAIRRSLRVGAAAGTPVEDLGIVPDVRHPMTKRDVLEGNVDLLDHAGRLLAALPVRRLDVAASLDGAGKLTCTLTCAGLDRVDVVVDDRPRTTRDVTGSRVTVTVTGVAGARTVRVEGFAAGALVAARTVAL